MREWQTILFVGAKRNACSTDLLMDLFVTYVTVLEYSDHFVRTHVIAVLIMDEVMDRADRMTLQSTHNTLFRCLTVSARDYCSVLSN